MRKFAIVEKEVCKLDIIRAELTEGQFIIDTTGEEIKVFECPKCLYIKESDIKEYKKVIE